MSLAIVSRGRRPKGKEDALIAEVRKRGNARHGVDGDALRRQALFALAPWGAHLLEVLPSSALAAMNTAQFADVVFELFEISAKRTRLMANIQDVFDFESQWDIIATGLNGV